MEYYSALCAPEAEQLLAEWSGQHGYCAWDAGEAEYAARAAVLADGAPRYGISAAVFDKHQELVWTANCGGHVTSYYGPEMQKYTSFQVHDTEQVRHLTALEHGLLALTDTTLRMHSRSGLPRHTQRTEEMRHMQCLLPISAQRVLLGGHQQQLLEVDLETWQQSILAEQEAGCAVLRCGGGALVACGGAGGTVILRDMRCAERVLHTVRAHSACLSDLDFQGDLLLTSGFDTDAEGGAVAESAARVWDVRRLGSTGGARCGWRVPLPADPLLLHFVPAVSGRGAAVTAHGQVTLFYVNRDCDPQYSFFQVESCAVSAFDISATAQALLFGDAAGRLQLYSPLHNTEPVFNNFSRPTEFATPLPPLAPAPFSDTAFRASALPLPALCTGDSYFSCWPPQFATQAYRRPLPIDPAVLRSMKLQGGIGYAPNPRTARRNQAPYPTALARAASPPHIPHQYRQMPTRYNKGGVQEPEQHNTTGLVGLQAGLCNSYCNPMLQVLYYTSAVKAALLAHSCHKEFCLSCELGFLFRMLDTSSGAPCQAANFLRAFRTVPEAAALGLILSDHTQAAADRAILIQSWSRFILQQLHLEILQSRKPPALATASAPAPAHAEPDLELAQEAIHLLEPHAAGGEAEGPEREQSEISELFGVERALLSRCLKCNKQEERTSVALCCALEYGGDGSAAGACDGGCAGVEALLRSALAWRRTTPAWCTACDKFSPTAQRARLTRLSPILVINCGAARRHCDNQQPESQSEPEQSEAGGAGRPCRYGVHCARAGCRFQHPRGGGNGGGGSSGAGRCALPLQLHITIQRDGEVSVVAEQQSAREAAAGGARARYELAAAVVSVGPAPGAHLVAFILHQEHWYLFNDVSIQEVEVSEVVELSAWWKAPCVLVYVSPERAGVAAAAGAAGAGAPGGADAELFAQHHPTVTPLAPHEMPTPGTLVGMDAEFVTLDSERVELRSDGQRATLRPSHMSVARITCVRGEGPLEGVPFIDDYISTQEQVVDYLTRFSGIQPGDLDANFSSKHLTTLKSTYRKLRALVDSGVVFVGHGLNNDFRVINLVVPPEQVVDTVQLFRLPQHRMVSLKFLAWHLLGERIQSGPHDSAEDARAALRLRRRWAELAAAGELRGALLELYRAGAAAHWQVPPPSPHSSPPPPEPS